MDTVLSQIGAAGQNQVMCSTALSFPDEDDLMAEFGFTIAAGNRIEKGINYFGHMVWNPWRAANSDEPGYDLEERTLDLSAELSGQVQVTEAAGEESVLDAAALPLTETPLFVEPLE